MEFYGSVKRFFRRYQKYLLFFGALLFSFLIFIFRGDLVHLQSLGYVGIFLISVLGNATVIFPVPVFITALVGGAILNPLLVGIISSLGATIGELTGYAAGFGGGEMIKKDVKIAKVKKWMQKYGLWALFFLAAIPNPAFDLAGIAAGAAKIPIYKYFLAVWCGKLIKFIIIAYVGYLPKAFV